MTGINRKEHYLGPQSLTATGTPGLYWGQPHGKKIALSFDDGPNPTYTPLVLDYLKAHNIKATFFVIGQNAARYPALIRRIVAEGHTLGNHTWDHKDLSKMTAAQVRLELKKTQTAVDKALGYHYPLKQIRPPGGATNATVGSVIRAQNGYQVLWNVDSNDWREPGNVPYALANIFSGTGSVYRNGGVILEHDIHPLIHHDKVHTYFGTLPKVVRRLEREHFTIETTGQMLAEKYGPAAAKEPAALVAQNGIPTLDSFGS